jgi:hypothetical protein
MAKERIMKDIPKSEVNQVVKDFESEGCNVEIKEQPNGNFTVIATCPDE